MDSKPNVMVVCAHLHGDRTPKSDRDFMQPSAGLHIASLIDPDQFNVSLYHEMWHGTLDVSTITKIDLVFLTGLQKDFDRMRQLAYFFKRKGATIVAGGSICTLFPEFACQYFDVVSVGTVDAVAAVLRDYLAGNLKKVYCSTEMTSNPYRVRYQQLTESGIITPIHLIEASRGCNFKCDFCIIPAEKSRHQIYGVDHVLQGIRDSIAAAPRLSLKRLYPVVWFIDNNFANNLDYTRELCAALKAEPQLKGWGALVTSDVLSNKELIRLMADSKCRMLFTGLESLDPEFLTRHRKYQNLKNSDSLSDKVRYAYSNGILVIYGYLFDPRISDVGDMRRQLNDILHAGFSFPNFLSYVSPLLGTPLFWEAAEKGQLRPGLRIRDLDGQCIAYKNCLNTDKELEDFSSLLFKDIMALLDIAQYHKVFLTILFQLIFCHPILWYLHYKNHYRIRSLIKKRSKKVPRNYLGGQDVLDAQYNDYPQNITIEERQRYFDPIIVIEDNGDLAAWLLPYRPSLAVDS